MRHVDLAVELCLLNEVRQACAVVHMEVCHQQQLDLLWIDSIEVGQLLNALTARMQAAVEHDLAPFALKVDAAAAYLTARAEGSDLEDLSTSCLDLARDANLQFAEIDHLSTKQRYLFLTS